MAVNNQQRTINSIISPFPGRPRWCDRPSIIHTLSLLPLALSPFQPLIKFLHASGALRFIRSKSDLLPSFLRSASRFDTLHFLSCTSPCFLKTWLYRRNLFRLSHAKLQLNHHHQQTNTQFFFTGRMPFLSPNQQCQRSTEEKNITFHGLAYPKLTWGSSNFVSDY